MTNSDRQEPIRVALYTLLIVALYMGVRSLIYHCMPVKDAHGFSWDLWFRRDVFMTLSRLVCFALCLALASAFGGISRWGWTTRFSAAGAALIALESAGFAGRFAFEAREIFFSSGRIAIAWLTSLPVALFEEAAFRGLLYLALRRRFKALPSAAVSAALFMAYHYQAQRISEWPMIFSFGFVACAALEAGLGLPWLVLAHEIVDAVWFNFGTGGKVVHPWGHHAAVALCLAAALSSAWRLRES